MRKAISGAKPEMPPNMISRYPPVFFSINCFMLHLDMEKLSLCGISKEDLPEEGAGMIKEINRRRGQGKDRPSVEEYLRMGEEEKDVAIQKAVIRLQSRIQQILYHMDAESKRDVESNRKGGEQW